MCPRLRWSTARRARLEAEEEERAAVEVGLVDAGGGGGGGPVQAGFDSTMASDLLVFVMKTIDASVVASANSTSYMVCAGGGNDCSRLPQQGQACRPGTYCCEEGGPY